MRSGRRKSYGNARLAGSSSSGAARRFRNTSSISSWDRTRSVIYLSIGSMPAFFYSSKSATAMFIRCRNRQYFLAAKIESVSSFHVHNFGCRASQADGAAIESALLAQGMHPAEMPDAGLVVLNTCTVTALADQDVR